MRSTIVIYRVMQQMSRKSRKRECGHEDYAKQYTMRVQFFLAKKPVRKDVIVMYKLSLSLLLFKPINYICQFVHIILVIILFL